ncbi:uncharacterized transmembrane protein DDB_G0289901-like isoform X4 [Ruditapes philippinarum]|uniref:uncharacterized transmembrane protein DDB_G0289901-like isoform X4 n=1 Tax=Ruditapes philippinarum TaxID=129788 RepID=UPI00295C1949|nr:uncharacterized transmembrane protein DDB_G0289901-like isoform X4 [Ruditapes philippinarum]
MKKTSVSVFFVLIGLVWGQGLDQPASDGFVTDPIGPTDPPLSLEAAASIPGLDTVMENLSSSLGGGSVDTGGFVPATIELTPVVDTHLPSASASSSKSSVPDLNSILSGGSSSSSPDSSSSQGSQSGSMLGDSSRSGGAMRDSGAVRRGGAMRGSGGLSRGGGIGGSGDFMSMGGIGMPAGRDTRRGSGRSDRRESTGMGGRRDPLSMDPMRIDIGGEGMGMEGDIRMGMSDRRDSMGMGGMRPDRSMDFMGMGGMRMDPMGMGRRDPMNIGMGSPRDSTGLERMGTGPDPRVSDNGRRGRMGSRGSDLDRRTLGGTGTDRRSGSRDMRMDLSAAGSRDGFRASSEAGRTDRRSGGRIDARRGPTGPMPVGFMPGMGFDPRMGGPRMMDGSIGVPMSGMGMPMGGLPMPMGGMGASMGGSAMPMGGSAMSMGGMPMGGRGTSMGGLPMSGGATTMGVMPMSGGFPMGGMGGGNRTGSTGIAMDPRFASSMMPGSVDPRMARFAAIGGMPGGMPSGMMSSGGFMPSGTFSSGMPGTGMIVPMGSFPFGMPGGFMDSVPMSGAMMPSGMASGIPSGMSGGMPSGMPSGMSGGMPSGMSGGMSGGMPSGMSGGMPSGMSGGMPFGGFVSGLPARGGMGPTMGPSMRDSMMGPMGSGPMSSESSGRSLGVDSMGRSSSMVGMGGETMGRRSPNGRESFSSGPMGLDSLMGGGAMRSGDMMRGRMSARGMM